MRWFATLLFLCPMVAAAAGARISSEFAGPALVFKLTVANPDTAMRHVMKVGVHSRVHGSFGCLTESTTVISLADYPISFAVVREETLTDADPEIRLPPGSSAAFTVSLYPHATGACGPWSSDVSVIVVFDDDSRLESPVETIDESDLEALRTRNPQRDEVLQGLSHRNVDLRLQSLRQLGKIDLDRVTLEDKVRLALQDPDRRVRSEAYRQIAPLNLQTLTPELIKRLAQISVPDAPEQARQANSAELLELGQAFTKLRAAGAEASLVGALTNQNFMYPEALGDALQKIRTPAMPQTLAQALTTYRAWATDPKLATRYDILLKALIAYRDAATVPLLKSLMTPHKNRRAAWVILNDVLMLTDINHRVEDPFVLAFRDLARGFMTDPWGDDRRNLRASALVLSVRISDNPAEQVSLLRAGLRDRSPQVQLSAAQETAALALTTMTPDLLKSYHRADESLRPYFCNALTALNAKCPEQGGSP